MLVILTAISVGILYLWKLRSYDVYEKEPFLKLLLISVLGGIVSVLVALFLYEFVNADRNFFDAIFKIGLIEEFSKLFALFILYLIIRNDFNEIVDGLMYMSAVALGFAIIENILYAFNSELPYHTLLLRSVYSVLGHISFAGYLGIAFFIHKKVHPNYLGLLLSVFIAALAHGFYDGFIFHEEISFLFNLVFICIVVIQFWIYRLTLGFSRFRGKLADYEPEIITETKPSYCSKCDIDVESNTYHINKIESEICTSCGSYRFDEQNTVNLLRYFRPVISYKRFMKKTQKNERITFLDDGKKLYFNTERNFLSSNINDLTSWLEIKNIDDRRRILNIPVFGWILKGIGLRYLMKA